MRATDVCVHCSVVAVRAFAWLSTRCEHPHVRRILTRTDWTLIRDLSHPYPWPGVIPGHVLPTGCNSRSCAAPRRGCSASERVAALGAALLNIPDADRAPARVARMLAAPAVVTIGATPAGPSIPRGFVGFSLEFPAVPAYAGASPGRPDPVFSQLVRNVAPGGTPVIRVGGDSTDATWWPVRGMTRPRGITYSLTPGWVASTRRLADALGARLILGINLKIGEPRISLAEARAMLQRIGRRRIAALEIGNEPLLYGRFPFYRRLAASPFMRDHAGTGCRSSPASSRRSPHGSPACRSPARRSGYRRRVRAPSLPRRRAGRTNSHAAPLSAQPLLSSRPSPKFADRAPSAGSVRRRGPRCESRRLVAIARQVGLPMQIDELNSVSCSGKRGISDTFASALWGLDELFGMARERVAGINIHTFPGAAYAPFAFAHTGEGWSASVTPMYYGLLAFAAAAPPGARLLPVSVQSGPNLSAWATRTRNRRLRVVLINKGADRRRAHPPRGRARALADRQRRRGCSPQAPRHAAASRLGGQSFGRRTLSGRLSGRPGTVSVIHSDGPARSRCGCPPPSAAVLTMRCSAHRTRHGSSPRGASRAAGAVAPVARRSLRTLLTCPNCPRRNAPAPCSSPRWAVASSRSTTATPTCAARTRQARSTAHCAGTRSSARCAEASFCGLKRMTARRSVCTWGWRAGSSSIRRSWPAGIASRCGSRTVAHLRCVTSDGSAAPS